MTKILELVNEGNKYLRYFIFVFLFILLAIVIPLKHPVDKSVNDAIVSVNAQIAYLNTYTMNLLRQRDTVYEEASLKVLQEKFLELEAKKTNLLKERIALIQMGDKNVNLPILNVSISQSIILATFMGFILIGLCMALHYRSGFFACYDKLDEEAKKEISIPFWCAPIPFTTKSITLKEWMLKNSVGIFMQVIIIYLGLDSISTARKVGPETNAVNIIIYMFGVAVYLITLTQMIKQEWRRERM